MEITWSGIKEVFFAIGSVAGLFAAIRPVFESKLKQDEARFAELKKTIDESWLYSLNNVGKTTELNDAKIKQLDELHVAFTEGRDIACFSGPFSKLAHDALNEFVQAWFAYRKLVRAGPWLPLSSGWRFDLDYFMSKKQGPNGLIVQDLGSKEHLKDVRNASLPLIRSYKKLMLVSQLHLLEWPIKGLLLRRRAAAQGIES